MELDGTGVQNMESATLSGYHGREAILYLVSFFVCTDESSFVVVYILFLFI